MSYAPNLIVEERIKISKIRELPLPGRSLVKVGDKVEANTPVLSAELPGELVIVRLAEKLGIEPEKISNLLKVSEGQEISKGEILAEASGLFGWLKDTITAPATGKIEYFINSTGHLGIRLPSKTITLSAYISGNVINEVPGSSVTIETVGALIQGIFGVGGERSGIIHYLKGAREVIITESYLKELDLAEGLSQKILCGGITFTLDAIRYAALSGAVGIFTGSITSAVLEQFTGRDLGISMTGDEDLPLSLVISEGFGELSLSERIEKILIPLSRSSASLSGVTQVRAGAIRPELIITENLVSHKSATRKAPIFEAGRKVRCLRSPHFGKIGEIIELPSTPQKVNSGATVRVALVNFGNNQNSYVPRANLEIVD